MSSKTLSTGTLSLRFMQNAHRAKQLAQVEAEQAQVKDEAEWEVSKEIRDAWGISAGTSTSEKAFVIRTLGFVYRLTSVVAQAICQLRGIVYTPLV